MSTTNEASPQTLQEIRDLMRKDLTLVAGQHLLAILLGTGSRRQGEGKDRPEKKRTAVEMAEDIYAALGGSVAGLLGLQQRDVTKCQQRFGLGEATCRRLLAATWLAIPRHMPLGEKSEAELTALVLGAEDPDTETAGRLFEEYGSPQELMRSMSVDAFESFRKNGAARVRLPRTEIEPVSFCRLVAVVELRARYGGRYSQRSSSPVLEPGMFGLESAELVEVLNPANYLNLEHRDAMLNLLRSHPQLSEDFSKLDRLAIDARTSNCYRAIEISLTFEWLCRLRTWSHPSEVLEIEEIPYDLLLAIAQSRIARSGESARVSEIKALLEQAAKEATVEPIESFIEALEKRKLPKAFVETAIEEARRGYLEKHREKERGADTSTALPEPKTKVAQPAQP